VTDEELLYIALTLVLLMASPLLLLAFGE